MKGAVFCWLSTHRQLFGNITELLHNLCLIWFDVVFWEVSPGSVEKYFLFFILVNQILLYSLTFCKYFRSIMTHE